MLQVLEYLKQAHEKGGLTIENSQISTPYINGLIVREQKKGNYSNYNFSVLKHNTTIFITCEKQTPGLQPDKPYWNQPIPTLKNGNVDFDKMFAMCFMPVDFYKTKGSAINIKSINKIKPGVARK